MTSNRFAWLLGLVAGRAHRVRKKHPATRAVPRLEALEHRDLLSSVPVLNSNPGAPHTLFLDFDGHQQARFTDSRGIVIIPQTTVRPFSVDADTASLSAADRQAIVEIWRRVAEDFAPFNVNVTTVEPPSLAPGVPDSAANGRALRIAVGDRDPAASDRDATLVGAVSDPLLGSYNNTIPNVRFVFPARLLNDAHL